MIKNIRKRVIAISILLLTHLPFCQAAATDEKAAPAFNATNPFHRTLKVRVGPAGVSCLFDNYNNSPNFKKSFGYTVDNDIEYGRGFGKKKKWYWSIALSWNLFDKGQEEPQSNTEDSTNPLNPSQNDKNQVKHTLSLIDRVAAGPITHLLLGYTINPKNQVLLGFAYVWGITTEYRYCLTQRLYLSTKVVYWLDRRFFDSNRGIHDMYATIGIGYITL